MNRRRMLTGLSAALGAGASLLTAGALPSIAKVSSGPSMRLLHNRVFACRRGRGRDPS